MEIHDDLEIMLCSPVYRFVQIRCLSLNKGLSTRDIIRPVTYRDADVIQTENLISG